jgi:hypothetical protein
MWQALVAPITTLIDGVLDKVVPDAAERDRISFEIQKLLMGNQSKELEQAVKVILAEAQGESWLQRNWRPILMLWFAGLVGAHWLGFTPPNLPESVVIGLLDIVQVGIGGYVLGRSGEKIIREWKK